MGFLNGEILERHCDKCHANSHVVDVGTYVDGKTGQLMEIASVECERCNNIQFLRNPVPRRQVPAQSHDPGSRVQPLPTPAKNRPFDIWNSVGGDSVGEFLLGIVLIPFILIANVVGALVFAFTSLFRHGPGGDDDGFEPP